MKSYYLRALTLLSCLFIVITTHAYDFKVDGVYYNYLSNNNTCEVTDGQKAFSYNPNLDYIGSVVVPEIVTYGKAITVVGIGNKAFNGCDGLKSVTIGDSVTSIGEYAFAGCTGLTKIVIPSAVSIIGEYAFMNTSKLTSIECKAITPPIISSNTFSSDLKYITIPAIALNKYQNADYWNTFVFQCNVDHINYNIISETEVEVSGITQDSLKNITIPESVEIDGSTYNIVSIAQSAFSGCSGLTKITIPNSVTSIGSSAFSGCSGLTSITIPNSVTSIGSSAFSGCSSLTNVKYNATNCTINGDTYSSVFGGCTKLISVTIGKNVKEIPNYIFKNCTALKELIIEDGESILSLGYNSYSSGSGTGDGLFYGCPLQTLYLGRNLSYNTGKKYGYSPFYNNSSLKTVTIGKNVTSIGSWAFSGCSGLTSIEIPNSVTSIGEQAFWGCTGLTYFNISDLEAWCKIDFGDYSANPLYYEKKLYLNGELLTALVVPNSITDIKNYAFFSCTSLTSVTIPNSVTSIGYSAFDGCSGLTSITIPEGVTSIGSHVFRSCSSLTSITIPNSVTSIGDAAFYGCSGLSSITIPNSVTSIGSDALFGCTGLCSIKRNATATTQTKLNFDITNNTEYEFYIKVNNKTYSSKDKTIEIPELAPYSNPSIDYGLRINDRYCKIYSESKYYTKPLNQKLETENGDFYIKAKGSYEEGDATILGTMLSFQKEPTEYDNLNEKTFSLDPNTNYTVYYSVNTKEGGVYSTSKTFTTGALTWSDEEYQATSTTSARLMTATNCDATEGTGFEWRRYGAPENLKPNAVACPVIDGMLIGSLRNLNSEAYYEFRPYYTSSSGNTHYGEWTALFTGDANVYFEPEVRTYEDVMVATNKATLKGYALAGTDDIISQGFEYWESLVQPGTANSLTASVNSKKVEVSGISMTTTISDLKYGTTYCYRAFATTASGTIYGETVEFTTEKDLSGIENVIVEEDETVEYYNLQGVRVENPERGLYIKRQGGKTSKVIL